MKNKLHIRQVLLLMLLVATTLTPATAHDFEVDGIYYNILSDTEVEVTYKGNTYSSYDNEYSDIIVIPDNVAYDDITYNVTSIGNHVFRDCESLTSVTIPKSVTSIGMRAFENSTGLKEFIFNAENCTTMGSVGYPLFYDCKELTSVKIGDCVKIIPDNAFSYCRGITSLVIPNSVTFIGVSAFSGCSNLIKLDFNAENCTTMGSLATPTSPSFYNCWKLTTINIGDDVKIIPDYAFSGCSYVTALNIGKNVVSIGKSSFVNFDITSVTIPESVTSIGDGAFNSCSSLSEFNFNARNCSYMGSSSFPSLIDCQQLVTVKIGSDVETIPDYAFSNCKSINSIISQSVVPPSISDNIFSDYTATLYVPQGCVETYKLAEHWNKFDIFSIGESVVEKGTVFQVDGISYKVTLSNKEVSVISDNESSTGYVGSIVIPATVSYNGVEFSVTTIDSYAFHNCTGLTSVSISESIVSIGDGAFSGCTELSIVNFNAVKCEYMGSSYDPVFNNCANLTTINVGESVKSIPACAFYGCTGLGAIIIPDNVIFIGACAFWDCQRLANIELGKNVELIDYCAFGHCVGLNSITIPKLVQNINNNAFYNCTGLKEFNLNAENCIVMENIFEGCSNLTTINIGNSVKTIPHQAFSGCKNVTSIEIPQNVTSIGFGAFYDCTGLTRVYISDLSAWCNIKFGSEHSNPLVYAQNLYINNNVIKDLIISNDIDTIGDYAFYGCSGLNTVHIPSSVVSIGYKAFGNCSSLTGVYITDIAAWYRTQFLDYTSNPLYYAKKLYVNNSLITDLVIPADVTDLSYSLVGCTNLNSIKVEAGNTTYDSRENCNAVIDSRSNILILGCRNTTIPESVKEIENYAFANSNNTQITIPKSVKEIGIYAFSLSSDLTVTILGNIYSDDYNDKSSLSQVFNDCSNVSVIYGEGVERLNYFENCEGLTSITISNSITTPIYSHFYGCSNLASIVLGSGIPSITYDAFRDCQDTLHRVELLGEKYYKSFEYCSELDTLLMPNVTDISEVYFDNFGFTKLKKLDIGSAESLNEGLLRYSSSLTDLTLPFIGTGERATATGKAGLLGSLFGTSKNDEMRAVTQYYSEDKSTIYYLPAQLEKLTITEGCTELGYGALYGVSTLKEVTLPSSLYLVGEKAFYGCAGLEHIYCKGASPAACFDNTFTGVRTASCVLHVPYNSTDLYARSTGWKDFYYIQAEKPITIGVTYNIRNGGIVQGLTEYESGEQVTLTAIANSGYRFVAWIENGVTVCNDATYTFTATGDCDLLVVFMAVPDENNVTVTPDANQVYFTWEMEEGVDIYTLTIYADAAMTTVVNTLQFDAEGNLLQRVRAEQGGYMIDGLSPQTSYYYDITGTTKEGLIISQYVGSFTTIEDSGVDKLAADEVVVYPNPTTDYIAVTGVAPETIVALYAMDGTLLLQKQATAGVLRIDMQNYCEGVYLLRVGNQATKVVKH